MKKNLVVYSLVFIVTTITFSGCVSEPKSFKEITLDDMYPILTTAQYRELKSMSRDTAVVIFVDEYWRNIDSSSGMSRKEIKTEYLQRLAYANEHFPDHRGLGRSDRKRIYVIYGTPSSIDKVEFTNNKLGKLSTVKSVEIWSYLTPGKNNSLPSRGNTAIIGEMKFIFGDVNGAGNYQILYSSEDPGDIDARMFGQ